MDSIKKTLSAAVIRILIPIVRMLLRYDISHSEFTELSKRAYVDVAFNYFSIEKRKKTFSRVSVITGLSRKEVVRISEFDIDEAPVTKGPLNRARRVIGGWLSDSDFLDDNNEAQVLALRGTSNSFDVLATRYSGGITSRAILDELIRVGAVKKVDKTFVCLTHDAYVPHDSDVDLINVMATHVGDHLDTSIHNLIEKQNPYFQRQVTYIDLPQSIVTEFKQLSRDKSSALLVELNQWLAERKKMIQPESNEPLYRLGIGVYYIKSDTI